jgi:hypothetical protein
MKESKQSKGGQARAVALSQEDRKAIAKKAAAARWGGKMLQATHKGNFQGDFGIDVECYVLNDDSKTAVISQTGMGRAVGFNARGSSILKFVDGRTMSSYVSAELREKLENPLKFQWRPVGAEHLVSDVNGYDVTLLIDICKAIVAAEGAGRLLDRQLPMAQQAHIILGASAKAGIKGLVYALSGYDPTKEEVIAAFKTFVREEAREWEREFPEQLYEEWYRIYEIPRPERNRPWKFKHLTEAQVYKPLARSSGRVLDLTKKQRDESGDRNKRLHQFLSEVGVKALRSQLGQLLGIARLSSGKEEYEANFKKLFGEQYELNLK